mmetsp:Transcript_4014/g.8830  ORF Transcript_4014/g.8830 Transcript_4014/m.8830 type:complete len:384 (+) Transcript_4014:3337-4488(+)
MVNVAKVMDLKRVPKFEELEYTDRFPHDKLENLRKEGDPLADECIKQLVEKQGKLSNIFDLLNTIKQKRDEIPVFAELLEEAWHVPEWMDLDKAERGQKLIAIYAPFMGISLFAGSLVGGAMFQKQAVVTSMGQLSKNPTRRVTETAYMISKMIQPGELSPGGEAHETLVRVRLLHAALRYHLVDSGAFVHPREVPINQQDLATTLGLFGYMNLRSLRRLNVRLSKEDVDSFMLMWRYAGYLLGIQDDLLPRTLLDQQEFFMTALKSQCKPDAIPVETKGILDGIAKSASEKIAVLPFSTAQRYLHQMTRFLSGNDYCTGMQINDEGNNYWGIVFTKLLGSCSTFIDHSIPYGSDMLFHLNKWRMSRIFSHKALATSGHRAKL